MNHYLDIVHQNHSLSEFSSSDSPTENHFRKALVNQAGGSAKNIKDVLKKSPTGSFPPIFKINKEEKEKEKQIDKTRAFAQVKTALSIKDIMEDRRVQSFISL
jgi:hypothetical protein